MSYREYKIEKEYESVYYFLKDNGFSENYITNLRKKMGYIVVNNTPCNIRMHLNLGDSLKIEASPNNKTTIMQCIIPLDVVYEDKYYLLINKPSGISCMPNKSHYSYNLGGAICHYLNNTDNFVLRIVNRLDKDTAGLILVAKDSIAQKDVRNIKKSYHAICVGKIENNITVSAKIGTKQDNGINIRKRAISDDGQDAETFVYPIKHSDTLSLVKIDLNHGRTHQIRVHLSSNGTPLLGDELYGSKSDLISHTALLCKIFSFYHPYLDKQLSFEVDYPDDFKKVIELIK